MIRGFNIDQTHGRGRPREQGGISNSFKSDLSPEISKYFGKTSSLTLNSTMPKLFTISTNFINNGIANEINNR